MVNAVPASLPRISETPTATLLEWESPVRVFIKRDAKYLRTILLSLLAIGLVLVIFQQWLLYAGFLALAFVSLVLRSVPPEKVSHKITDHGLTSGHHSYLYKELRDFWFTQKEDYLILNIDTNLRFPPRIFILVDKNDAEVKRERVIELLSAHIPYREIPVENIADKLFDLLAQKFNLN